MAIPWNEDHPRDAALIVQNLTSLLRQAAREARLRHDFRNPLLVDLFSRPTPRATLQRTVGTEMSN